jgi:hypothetical protein
MYLPPKTQTDLYLSKGSLCQSATGVKVLWLCGMTPIQDVHMHHQAFCSILYTAALDECKFAPVHCICAALTPMPYHLHTRT